MAKRWYIVHAYSNFENKVADSIKEQATAKGLNELFEQVLSIHREAGNREGEMTSLTDLGHLFRFQGRLEEAWQLYEQSLDFFREVGDASRQAALT
jgi:transcription antitermination factor NusG